MRYFLWSKLTSLAISAATGRRYPESFMPLIRDSGILPQYGTSEDLRIFELARDAEDSFIRGDFIISINKKKAYMEELYTHHHVDKSSFFAANYSTQYVSNIGHIAWLYAHLKAQEIGLISEFPRAINVHYDLLKNPLLQAIESKVRLVPHSGIHQHGELPLNWHNFERLDIIKTFSGFIDPYMLVDEIFSKLDSRPETPLIDLGETYMQAARKKLVDLGLPKDAWFVGLHIRNAGSQPNRRNQPNESYIPAIERINRLGGWVIRIGDATMAPLSESKMFIDLARGPKHFNFLHPYVLAASRFFIGTTSGPSFVAPFFGTPCLITNVTSIGRNTLRSSKNSIYLPKKVNSGDLGTLSLNKTLRSPEGFGELSLRELSKFGLSLQPNTAQEIDAAVNEMYLRLTDQFEPNESLNKVVQEIRGGLEFASTGEFSQTFIGKNPNWLDVEKNGNDSESEFCFGKEMK